MMLKIGGVIASIKQIDERLLELFTYSFIYPSLEDRPQTRLALVATLIAVEITIVALILQNNLLLTVSLPFWINTFYEWRLWYRLRK